MERRLSGSWRCHVGRVPFTVIFVLNSVLCVSCNVAVKKLTFIIEETSINATHLDLYICIDASCEKETEMHSIDRSILLFGKIRYSNINCACVRPNGSGPGP